MLLLLRSDALSVDFHKNDYIYIYSGLMIVLGIQQHTMKEGNQASSLSKVVVVVR